MLIFIFLGLYVLALIVGAIVTINKKNWRMFLVFSFFLLGTFLTILIPYLMRASEPYNLNKFVYLNSLHYLFYIIAILILIQTVLKRKGS